MINKKLGFTPLQHMNNYSNLDFGNTSRIVVKKKHFLSVRGLTLIELMIATGILVVVLSGLLLTFISCILLNESNNNLVIAVNDAQYVLEQIKGLAYSEIGNYTVPQFNNLANETVTLTRSIGTRIAEVAVDVSWIERQRQRNFQLSTRIAR